MATGPKDRMRPTEAGTRQTLYDIIFLAETPAGRGFDIALLIAIVASIAVVAMETMPGYRDNPWLSRIELLLTILFTGEYLLRLACVRYPLRYARSFWGIIDLLSFMPSYTAFFLGGNSRSFVILRSIRLLRVFRILKLWRMMSEADDLAEAVWKVREKIIVFLCVVLVAVTISGTLMFHIESMGATEENPSQFTSIPQAMYWAIVTMTTVGYGDVVPQTAAGKVISAVLILLGYSLIIVPSTFVSAEISAQRQGDRSQHSNAADRQRSQIGDSSNDGNEWKVCLQCGDHQQRRLAAFCDRCGSQFVEIDSRDADEKVDADENVDAD